MRIKNKLLLSFVTILVIFVIAGAGIIWSVSRITAMNDTVRTQVAINDEANDHQRAQVNKHLGLYIYLQGNPELGLTLIEEGEKRIEEAQKNLNELLTDPELLQTLNGEINEIEEGVEAIIGEMVAISDGDYTGKDAILAVRLSDLGVGITILNQRLDEFRAVTDENVASARVAAQTYGNQVLIITAAAVLISASVSLAIALTMGNRISSPINQLSKAAHDTSLGNFNQKLDIETGDEIEELGESFNRMLNSFKMLDAMNKGALGDETNES